MVINSKHEIRNSKQIQMTKIQKDANKGQGLGRQDFGILISDVRGGIWDL